MISHVIYPEKCITLDDHNICRKWMFCRCKIGNVIVDCLDVRNLYRLFSLLLSSNQHLFSFEHKTQWPTDLRNLFRSLPVMILMKISSYLILEAEHRHTIRRKWICNPIWLAIAFSHFGRDRLPGVFGSDRRISYRRLSSIRRYCFLRGTPHI